MDDIEEDNLIGAKEFETFDKKRVENGKIIKIIETHKKIIVKNYLKEIE